MILHSSITGSGKPFLILHGFLGMGDNWKTLANQFAESGYEMHLVDQRNHGRSFHSDTFNYEVLADDLKAYCDEHELTDVILLGHSMGGKTAMLFAMRYPELLEKLVIADIAPKYYAPHHQQILKGLTALDNAQLNSRGDAEEFLGDYIKEPGVKLFLLKNLYWKTKVKLSLRMNLDVLKEKINNLGEALYSGATYNGPVLFIDGEKSDYITEADYKLIKQHFPEAEVATISKAGHWVHAENMKDFYVRVSEFL